MAHVLPGYDNDVTILGIKVHLELRAQRIPVGMKLKITDYGDLFVPVSEGEPKRILRMHKGSWFSGHLPGVN